MPAKNTKPMSWREIFIKITRKYSTRAGKEERSGPRVGQLHLAKGKELPEPNGKPRCNKSATPNSHLPFPKTPFSKISVLSSLSLFARVRFATLQKPSVFTLLPSDLQPPFRGSVNAVSVSTLHLLFKLGLLISAEEFIHGGPLRHLLLPSFLNCEILFLFELFGVLLADEECSLICCRNWNGTLKLPQGGICFVV